MTIGPASWASAARGVGLIALGVALSACGAASEATIPSAEGSTAETSLSASAPSAPYESADGGTITGTFAVGDRVLWISCSGTGSPTLVLEAGEAVPSHVMATPVRRAFASRVRVCAYDRANTGASSSARTPRAAAEIAADLNGLLAAAHVPAPYVLVGHSAGGMFVQSYARMYPDSVVGVVAMNPVPPWDLNVKWAFPAMTKAERQDETAYYDGANGESADYRLSTRQIDAAPIPAGVAFHLLISTIAQCDSPTDICGRTYPAYQRNMAHVAGEWPHSHLTEAPAGHEIYLDDMEAVIAAINDVLQSAKTTATGLPVAEADSDMDAS